MSVASLKPFTIAAPSSSAISNKMSMRSPTRRASRTSITVGSNAMACWSTSLTADFTAASSCSPSPLEAGTHEMNAYAAHQGHERAGEPEARRKAERLRDGIPVSAVLVEELTRLARELGLRAELS
jgi:LDH2 family malate/lactate/ureidoglycolate dehydrogenase